LCGQIKENQAKEQKETKAKEKLFKVEQAIFNLDKNRQN
jgi:hypothetical protein